MIDVVILCSLFGIFILVSFIKGIQNGNKIIEQEQEITQINLDNIDNYDGSGIGQKDIPR